MTLEACALIKVIPTQTERVIDAIRKMKGVRKAFIAFGRFDIVAYISVQKYDQMRIISAEINELDGVRSTETLVSA